MNENSNLRQTVKRRRLRITTLTAQYSQSGFQGTDPFFGERRKDLKRLLELRLLNRQLSYRRLAPKTTLGYAEKRSNVDLYIFHRTYLRVGFTTEF